MFKAQTSIDSFFKNPNNPNKDYNIKRYFYLKWENPLNPSIAIWLEKKPEQINFIEQINCDYIRKGYFFYICGYFPESNENSWYFSKEKVYKNIHYLKSHLQKSIRKQNEYLSVQTTYHMFKLDLNELLRRLPIIMLEDTQLHESFPILIWLMVANSSSNSSKFKMKLYIYEWILGCVYTCSKIKVKDNLELLEDNNCNSENKSEKLEIKKEHILQKKIANIDILNSYYNLDENYCSLLYSIHIRIAYGGMECDMNMLRNAIDIWNKRWLNNDEFNKINRDNIRPISIYVKELELSNWDLSSIDYHCNPKFIEYISKKYDDIDVDELKKLIWCNSSCINLRIVHIPYNIKLWNKIKMHVQRTQKYLLDSNY
jgi:hypothetical protein